MIGLKTQESSNFIKFFGMVQESAKKEGKVFFLECEDGHDDIIEGMEVCDLQGWLVPMDKSNEFEKIWKNDNVDDDWTDSFVFAVWNLRKNAINISFEE